MLGVKSSFKNQASFFFFFFSFVVATEKPTAVSPIPTQDRQWWEKKLKNVAKGYGFRKKKVFSVCHLNKYTF